MSGDNVNITVNNLYINLVIEIKAITNKKMND